MEGRQDLLVFSYRRLFPSTFAPTFLSLLFEAPHGHLHRGHFQTRLANQLRDVLVLLTPRIRVRGRVPVEVAQGLGAVFHVLGHSGAATTRGIQDERFSQTRCATKWRS